MRRREDTARPRGGSAAAAALVLLAAGAPGLFGSGVQEFELRVLYTSSLNGNLDGCLCGSAPRSGLVKRAAWLREHRLPEDILVDTGDIFDVTPDELLSQHIIETYDELGYAAVAVGDQELSSGVEKLVELRKPGRFLCNNLSIRGQDGTVTVFSESPLLLRSRGVSVGVVALIGPEVFALYPRALKDRLVVADPAASTQRLVKELRSQGASCIIVLYHGTVEAGLELASKVEGIDLMIVGHEQRLVAPRKVGSTVVASPGEDGNRLGVVSLRIGTHGAGVRRFDGEFIELSYLNDPDDPAVRARIEAYEQELRARIKERR